MKWCAWVVLPVMLASFTAQAQVVFEGADILQEGDRLTAEVVQQGTPHSAYIAQTNQTDSHVSIEQKGYQLNGWVVQYYGTRSTVMVDQEGSFNYAGVAQSGRFEGDNHARVQQNGTGNSTSIRQYHGGNSFDARIDGNDNVIDELYMFEGNATTVVQQGNGNDIRWGYLWGGTAMFMQYGDANQIDFGASYSTEIDQLSVEQRGTLNHAGLELANLGGTLNVIQVGDRNDLSASISGAGNNVSSTSAGDDNRIELDVVGDANLVSLQQSGIENAIDASLRASSAGLSISQSGGANNALVTLLDGAAGIYQTGNSNVANIHQVIR
ncbi:hypothetical protein [Pseudomonas matsuisoli]|uniref:Curlin associated repeat-containing protein n=1 Tax=Pseudomonas matsuisoli TaxID=1515666 RepID=A0A917PVP8_9PSED|nr:hypothetical protein [Pseudomonas matsuisoli]GGJ94139.1 hypothetical protein GCM10009304_20230 [Pseudomonas matsuisoli]